MGLVGFLLINLDKISYDFEKLWGFIHGSDDNLRL